MRRPLAILALLSGSAFAQQLTPPAVFTESTTPLTSFPSAPSAPLLLKSAKGEYSDEGRIAGLEGTVRVNGTFAGNGSVRDLKVERSLGLGLDESAVEVVSQQRLEGDAASAGRRFIYSVEFELSEKRSRWHLVKVEFKPPEGVVRPTFMSAVYPIGPGIAVSAYDEGRLIGAIGRAASVTLSFDINESGSPENFEVVNASAPLWGPEAVSLVQSWRFHPGNRGDVAVKVPCTVKLIWGPTDFEASAIARQVDLIFDPPRTDPSRTDPPLPAESASTPKPKGLVVSAPTNYGPMPTYTEDEFRAGIQGTVSLSFEIDKSGSLQNIVVEQSLDPVLDQQAVEAISKWVVPPTLLNGRVAKGLGTVQVKFSLTGVSANFNRAF